MEAVFYPGKSTQNNWKDLSSPTKWSTGKKVGVTIGVVIGILVVSVTALALYAKFGHTASMNNWMNHQFQPFFTAKLGPWLAQTTHQAGEWLGSHTLPTWASIALGTTAVIAGATSLGLVIKHFKREKTLEPTDFQDLLYPSDQDD